MILIADSGSTNTSWRLCAMPEIHQFSSEGLNPYFTTGEKMREIVNKSVISAFGFPSPEKITQVYFYGSGCSSNEKKTLVADALQSLFPKAKIEVESDLLGTARGTCGHQPGIAAILGTGSSSCEFDGEKISYSRPSLGYILGDEGSGAHLGKKLLRAFYYEEMPAHLHDALAKKTGNDRSLVLDHIYRQPNPNRYVASYARFLQHHIKDSWCRKLVYDAFTEFFDAHILHYNTKQNLLNISGSVGYYFGQILKEAASAKEINTGAIVESPVAGLVLYHLGEI
jgi:N-acetylglucosamine kinase-like BadF-type ATPase